MGQHINIPTSRTQCIGGYLAKPAGEPKGGIVVVQEIFGVTEHIRNVADRFAAAGYTAIAPAFFDHLESWLELDYDETGMARGKTLVSELGLDRPLEDVASAANAIASSGRIGVVGFCWGGTIALLSALRLGFPAVSCYGARNVSFLGEKPKAPVMFHFGEHDPSIPPEAVAQHRELLPQMEVHTYPGAGHAFMREADAHYHEPSARLAWQRTLAFFDRELAGA
ncbi:dienelactone hydrolase family protein [Rhodanobacter sp. PCA2]|uniref:dienelactone hydrolase family protein n=1 Tax=Rhodanobacter sp. PCA2 TaxID=2006117 RepID=UPI0015E7CE6C|nr:dienelactone hydrolase family protein [Rhodanobacter sp. PCA2]MBA2078153.1 carboxymethylenebutenolidase [Rhodanobacter sp. PCA2]